MVSRIAKLLMVALMAALVSCGEENKANTEFVAVSKALTDAVTIADPIAKHDKLLALQSRIDDISKTYSGTAAAVKIASDEKVGPYKPSELASEIQRLSKDPAFCARKPTSDCLLDWVARHEATLSDLNRFRATALRMTMHLRLGQIGAAEDLVEVFRKTRSDLIAKNQHQDEIDRGSPGPDDVVQYYGDTQEGRGGDFWKANDVTRPLSMVLRNGDIATIFRRLNESRWKMAPDPAEMSKLMALASLSGKDEVLRDADLQGRIFVETYQLEPKSVEIVKAWPREKLPSILGYYYTELLWKRLPQDIVVATVENWPMEDILYLPGYSANLVPREKWKNWWRNGNTPGLRESAGYLYLKNTAGEATWAEFEEIMAGNAIENRRSWYVNRIVRDAVINPTDALAAADKLDGLPQKGLTTDQITSSNRAWRKLAQARSSLDALDVVREAFLTSQVAPEESDVTALARMRPDLVSPSDMVDIALAGMDRATDKNRIVNQSYAIAELLVGTDALQGVKAPDVKRFYEGTLKRPELIDSVVRFERFDPLKRLGLADVIAGIGKAVEDQKAHPDAYAAYRRWMVTQSLDKGDLDAARSQWSRIGKEALYRLLAFDLPRRFGTATSSQAFDEIAKTTPLTAMKAIYTALQNDCRDKCAALYGKLPALWSNAAVSASDRSRAQESYEEYLWLARDRARLAQLVFEPDGVDPQVWYKAVDALLGILTASKT